jgi:hypothetical protein
MDTRKNNGRSGTLLIIVMIALIVIPGAIYIGIPAAMLTD